MILDNLKKQKLIDPPGWLPANTCYITVMGSEAYGVSSGDSDKDYYGFCIPPKHFIFPHLGGYIVGFDKLPEFNQWQQHHIEFNKVIYDLSIYSIVRYIYLCMDGNPNMLDSLFTPTTCVIHSNAIGNKIKDNRHLFLSKRLWPKLFGYAKSQLHKAAGKNPEPGSKRDNIRQQFGYDTKFLYHVVRLFSQAEQIFKENTLDLQEKSRRELMKAVRRGEMPEQDVLKWVSSKESYLENLYQNSKLPEYPSKEKIKRLLLECIEMHYGSLDIRSDSQYQNILQEIKDLAEKAL